MVQISTKRRNILVASIIIVALACSGVFYLSTKDNVTDLSTPHPTPTPTPTATPPAPTPTVTDLPTKDNVTVSGIGSVSGAIIIAPIIRSIEFQDIQTGTNITFHFNFDSKNDNVYHNFGNYSVTLKNRHTYNVYIGFSILGLNKPTYKEFSTTFTVDAAAGQTAITKNFDYPNPPESK
jgi:hypothetical protein